MIMNIKDFLCAACLLIVASGAFAQRAISSPSAPGNKQFYVETGGPGVLFSANYDQRFGRNQSTGFGFRIGVGYSLYDKEYDYIYGDNRYYDYRIRSYATFPVGLNYVFGKKTSPHAFEIGAGATVLTKKVAIYNYDNNIASSGNFIGHFSFMYRRQPVDGGFTWRIGFTPIIGTSGDIVPSAAIGLGYAF